MRPLLPDYLSVSYDYDHSEPIITPVLQTSLLNRVLGVLACFACLRAHVLGVFACLHAYVLGVLTCLCASMLGVFTYYRAWRTHVFDVLAYSRAWRAFVFTCFACLRACYDEMFYFLTCLRAWHVWHWRTHVFVYLIFFA